MDTQISHFYINIFYSLLYSDAICKTNKPTQLALAKTKLQLPSVSVLMYDLCFWKFAPLASCMWHNNPGIGKWGDISSASHWWWEHNWIHKCYSGPQNIQLNNSTIAKWMSSCTRLLELIQRRPYIVWKFHKKLI